MKHLLAFGAAALLLTGSANAETVTPAAQQQAASHASDISARTSDISARKRTSHRGRYVDHRGRYVDPTRSPYYLRPGVAPSFGYIGPPGYAGEYAWRRSIGQCVVDLGYGRWASCDSR